MNPFTKKYVFKDEPMPPLNEVCEGLTEDESIFWANYIPVTSLSSDALRILKGIPLENLI